MERLKRSPIFWVLLLVSVFGAPALAVKQAYRTNISLNGQGAGSALIILNVVGTTNQTQYMVRTNARPNMVITSVWLAPADNSWTIPLCVNGAPADDDCTYDSNGDIDIEGSITAAMLIAEGVTGGQFYTALRNGELLVHLSDGSTGTFVRFI
jgi:hypothetical protein